MRTRTDLYKKWIDERVNEQCVGLQPDMLPPDLSSPAVDADVDTRDLSAPVEDAAMLSNDFSTQLNADTAFSQDLTAAIPADLTPNATDLSLLHADLLKPPDLSNRKMEQCNGLDDDNNGVIDDVGAAGLDCFYEIWRARRGTDPDNHRLQVSMQPGAQPAAPIGYLWESNSPAFLIYRESYGINGLVPLYYCCKDLKNGRYDNFYTRNMGECAAAGYNDCKTNQQGDVLGHVFSAPPQGTFGRWQFAQHANKPATSQPFARLLEQQAPGHHFFSAYEPEVSQAAAGKWCCESAPQAWCVDFCQGSVQQPVGYVLTPK